MEILMFLLSDLKKKNLEHQICNFFIYKDQGKTGQEKVKKCLLCCLSGKIYFSFPEFFSTQPYHIIYQTSL